MKRNQKPTIEITAEPRNLSEIWAVANFSCTQSCPESSYECFLTVPESSGQSLIGWLVDGRMDHYSREPTVSDLISYGYDVEPLRKIGLSEGDVIKIKHLTRLRGSTIVRLAAKFTTRINKLLSATWAQDRNLRRLGIQNRIE